MTLRQYMQLKNVCDWLNLSLDDNGSYKEVYENWFVMDNAQKVKEIEVLIGVLETFIANEEDAQWISNFKDALLVTVKIKSELMEEN